MHRNAIFIPIILKPTQPNIYFGSSCLQYQQPPRFVYPLCLINWHFCGHENRFFSTKTCLALIFAKNRTFYIPLIINVLQKGLFSSTIKKAFWSKILKRVFGQKAFLMKRNRWDDSEKLLRWQRKPTFLILRQGKNEFEKSKIPFLHL